MIIEDPSHMDGKYLPLTHFHQRYLRDYQAQSHSDLQIVDARFNMTFWGELP